MPYISNSLPGLDLLPHRDTDAETMCIGGGVERGKSKKPPGSGIARNRAAKNGRTYPLIFCNFDVIESSIC